MNEQITQQDKLFQASVIGLNHKEAPLDLREQMAVSGDQKKKELEVLSDRFSLRDVVLLSTCNRVELYYYPGKDTPDSTQVFQRFADRRNVKWDEVEPYLYHYTHEDLVNHLFRVTGGLDSMIVGETEILHQVKSAYHHAKSLDIVEKPFHLLFQEALSGAKDLHDQTALSDRKTSVGGVAVEFVEKIFGSLNNKSVLMIGAGKTAKLCLEHIRSLNPETLYISNRSYDKARKLCEQWGGKPAPLELKEELLPKSDVVLVCTASEDPILNHDLMTDTLHRRKQEAMCVLDLSVPRNVAPECEQMEQLYLYNIDDLEGIVAENLEQQEEELKAAENIIQDRVRVFFQKWNKKSLDPFIKDLRKTVDDIVDRETSRTLNKIEDLDESQKEEIEQLAHRLKQKFLHRPISSLKKEAYQGDGIYLLEAARSLFRIDD